MGQPDDLCKIDTKAVKKRIFEDSRSIDEIAKAAGMSRQRFYRILEKGTARLGTIDKIRLAVSPRMQRSTICPELKKRDVFDTKTKDSTASQHKKPPTAPLAAVAFPEEVKRSCEIFEKVYALCREYTLVEIWDAVFELSTGMLCYLKECGFDLVDLYDETLKDIPEIKIEEEPK